ncbi:hypothetical protein [Edaphocola aurantiacus]|uniref:hypothetical protein n=1 Tax=Edaphocola aurantiacus TaxID=2601682 RepID=UPI001C9379E6|nr:hypothetical protein [Edaphocola aurantiacus]
MKNPVLPGLLLLCMAATPAMAQRYQGVSIRNARAQKDKGRTGWRHEVQCSAKFPNARGVSLAPWLSSRNLHTVYSNYAAGCAASYYATPPGRYAFGIDIYWDGNVRAVERNTALYAERKEMITALLQVKYYWSVLSSSTYRLYSALGAGLSYNRYVNQSMDGLHYGDSGNWRYEGLWQYQATVLGILCGSGKFRFTGELGYGTLWLAKIGLNYSLTAP